MSHRQSITIPGFSHGQQPIPAASRVGPLLVTGGIHGMDPDTGSLPEAMEDQVRMMFANLARIMTAAGGSIEDIARVTVFVKSLAFRDAVNAEWVVNFPNPESRPARHTVLNQQLAGRMAVQCDAIAFITTRGVE